MNEYMKHHLGNLSRQVGHDVSNRYSYILSQDELLNAYFQQRQDLQYALRKEIKRDRFILNSRGLEKELNRILEEAITEAANQMLIWLSEDANNVLQSVLDGIPSGTLKLSPSTHRFIKMLTTQAVNETMNIINEITNPNDDD